MPATAIQTVKDAITWATKDRSAAAVWLRENCEECKRYTFDSSGRFERKAWTLKRSVFDLPEDLEVTIVLLDEHVRAYCTNGIVDVSSVRIRCQTKWRSALCEAIFWTMGFVEGMKQGHRIGD